jgi:hypothetical protein
LLSEDLRSVSVDISMPLSCLAPLRTEAAARLQTLAIYPPRVDCAETLASCIVGVNSFPFWEAADAVAQAAVARD